MQALIAETRPSLLPEPQGFKFEAPSERDCRRAWEDYAAAYAAFIAIDHPQSRWVDVPESERAPMRAQRREKLDRLAFAYLAALERAKVNAKRRQCKKAKPAAAGTLRPQMRLFEQAWPERFDYIAERFPLRPRVSNDLELGSTVRSRGEAIGWRYIQHNQPTKDHVLIIDYDAPDGVPAHEIWKLAGLPAPTWVASTPGTPRGHIAYAIDAPICTSDAARLGPLRYLAAIEAAYREALNGDRGYAGLLTKNPVHPEAWEVSWIEPRPYSLGDLAAPVKLPKLSRKKQPQQVEPIGLGRKVHTFDAARFWAYSSIRHFWSLGFEAWHRAVREQVDRIGQGFSEPLPESHLRAIAKSIAKWTWQRMTPDKFATLVQSTHTSAVQALRGRQKGAKTRDALMGEALAMLAAGSSLRDAAKALGVTPKTVANWRDRAATPATPVPGLN